MPLKAIGDAFGGQFGSQNAKAPAVKDDGNPPQSCVDTSMRTNISISTGQHHALKEYAQQHRTTMSHLIRQSLAATLPLPVQDDVRKYIHDGQHTRERREEARVASILGKVK